MAHIRNIYLGDLRTEAIHLKSGNKLITDAPLDNNGKGEAFSPTDTVCAALSSCMITIMAMVAERESVDLKGIQTEVTKVMVANPRKISEIHIDFTIPNGLMLTDKKEKALENAALNCPVALSLHPEILKKVNFNFL